MSIAFANPDALSHDALEEGSAFAPRFDVNGLVTAIAVEASTNAVLMVAHMNAEALSKTLETGEAHFFSRSRQKLWKKGETSGEIQRVLELRTDCDQDALVLVVEQLGRGAACHTGRGSCFYRKLEVREGHVALVDTGAPKLFDPKEVYS